jgi:hypothetical protein
MSEFDYDNDMEVLFDSNLEENGIYPVKVLSGEFKDVVFRLGKAWFDEEDEGKLSFEMDVLEGKIDTDKSGAFNQFVGDYIIQMIMQRLQDEQRKNESDTEGDQG